MIASQYIKYPSTKKITLISLVALILGHLMSNTIIPNEGLNIVGLLVTSYLIFHYTLRKNDLFSFIMIIYFCSPFPYLGSKGGGFNMVCFICIGLYFIITKTLPTEKIIKDSLFKLFVALLVLSSVLGWIFNYTGSWNDFLYSFISFFSIILLLILSSSLEITTERLKVFVQLNFIIIIYSTLASLNKFTDFITFQTPMMPTWGLNIGYKLEGGGIIGSSSLYGEHSMILAILFTVFLLLGRGKYVSNRLLLMGVILSFLNVFMSTSRSVFLLSLFGMILIFVLQFRLNAIKIAKQIGQLILITSIGLGIFWTVKNTGLDHVLLRIDEINKKNKIEGGISLNRILDGSAFNRKESFDEGYKRYQSKDNWLIGYGWGTWENNRDAFYVDSSIRQGSAHSQLFAVLFILGWLGFIAYFGLILKAIIKSYKTTWNNEFPFDNKILAFFFTIAFILFFINETKVDCISTPTYFAVTIIWMGLAYSANNQSNSLSHPNCDYAG